MFTKIKKMKVSRRCFLLFLFYLTGCLGQDHQSNEVETNESFLVNLVWKCTKTDDVENCLKSKALNALDDLVRMKEPLRITEYLSLAKDPTVKDIPDLDNRQQGRNEDWDKIVWNRLADLFRTRTPQLTLPSDTFEGRGKGDKILKKGHGFFLMAAMMGGMMMKLAMGKIAVIAGKALIIGKIALLLSLIIALKKFASQGGGGHAEVVYASSEHGNGRKFVLDPLGGDGGADLAYNAHH